MIKSFKVGDVLSESSHYKVLADNGNLNFKLKHLESGDMVYIWKEEKITLEEYEARRSQSTCVYSIITERMFERGVD